MNYLPYTTRPGDRWDLIAWSHYGDANRFQPIIDANRALFVTNPITPIPPVLPVGLTLLIPILAVATSAADNPPWRG